MPKFLVFEEPETRLNHIANTRSIVRSILYISSVLFFFFLSIDLLISSSSMLGKEVFSSVLEVTANPFISLFIGLLLTALFQSSSTTTSMIVAMVASGSLEMNRAIPIMMGANIGTTLTSNIVSLSFITKKDEFRRAFSTATVHDHFNILVTAILFPLQYHYNLLGRVSSSIAGIFPVESNIDGDTLSASMPMGNLVVSDYLLELIGSPIIVIVLAGVMLFGSIKVMTKVISKILIGSTQLEFEKLVFKNPLKSFGWGTALTATVQSSSMTTSVVVPLVATGKIKFKDVYPFIVGANIGTTITALLAALFASPAAISIAIAHLLFNLIGGIIFLFVPLLNRIPVALANHLGELCLKHRIISIIYLIVTFFLLPFAFIYLTK